jgi:hypothetical protein
LSNPKPTETSTQADTATGIADSCALRKKEAALRRACTASTGLRLEVCLEKEKNGGFSPKKHFFHPHALGKPEFFIYFCCFKSSSE